MSISQVRDFEQKGFTPVNRPDLKPFKMEIPFDWSVNPYNDTNWCFQLNTLRYLMVYVGAFKESNEKSYIFKVLKWIEDWWLFTEANEVEFAWHDMATGIRAEKIYLIAKTCSDHSIEVPNFFYNLVKKHLLIMMSDGFFRSNHNHGMYVIHGIRCLAELIDNNNELLEFCENGWNEILDNQLDENYVHKEHSPHYHFLFVETLERYINTGFYQSFSKMYNCYIESRKNCGDLLLPDGREIPFGDTDNSPPKCSNKKLLNMSYIKTLSGYFIYRDFEELTYISLTNNYHSNVHKHWDNMSFIFGYKGQDILMDPGKYKYDKSSIRKKITSSLAHNTVNVYGESWTGKDLIKESLKLEANSDSFESFSCFSEMSIKSKAKTIKVQRVLKYKSGSLEVNDMTDLEGLYYSSFILNQDARLISINKNGVCIFKFNKVSVRFEFHDGDQPVHPVIHQTPVSYSYGSYYNSLTLSVNFSKRIQTKISILESEDC